MPPIPTPDEIPIFLGDLSPEDAANWLKTLVAATGHYSDTGMFRLLTTKFEDGSLAREWYDDLRDEAKTSWALFEREFRSRWISAPRQERQNKAVWDEFCNHKLIYSTIFAHDSLDPSKSRQVVHDWVEQHLRLGEAVSSEYEDKLVETTFNLLPVFLRAFLQSFNTGYTPNLRSLESCGKMVKQMPTNMYKFEWIRSQMAAEERYSEISKKVDDIWTTLHKAATSAPSPLQNPPRTVDSSSRESIAWEPCSPLTSAISTDECFQAVASGATTPTAVQQSLPNVEESDAETDQDPSFVAPPHWRKPKNLFSKEERIAIADRALNVILDFEPLISGKQAAIMNSAFAIYDRLTGRRSRNRDSRELLPNDRHPDTLWHSMEMIYRHRAMNQPLVLNQCIDAWESFLGLTTFQTPGSHFLRPEEYWVDNSRYTLHKSGGEAIFAGGLIWIQNWDSHDFRISSSRTVLFMALSSYLAESTNDPGFLYYAITSATCIETNMLDTRTGLVKHCHINGMNGQLKWDGNLSCHLTGIFIEGLSVLATVSGDYTWRSLAIATAESAMKLREWHDTDGVLSVLSSGSELFKSDGVNATRGLLSRGLMVAYQRNTSDKAFRSLVRSYINTQFNALIDLASRDDTYSVSWNGPYIGPYFHGQLAALDTLIAAIAVNR